MSPGKSPKHRLVLTGRLAAGITVGALILALGAVFGPGAIILDAIWVVALVVLARRDARMVRQAAALTVSRQLPRVASLGYSSEVICHLHNPTLQNFRVRLKEWADVEVGLTERNGSVECSAGKTATASFQILPQKRGTYQLGPLVARASTALRFFELEWIAAEMEEIRILPGMQPTREHDLLARTQHLNMMGIRSFRRAGAGMEFKSLREYTAGDEMRLVDWKATARRGKLIVKEWDIERSQNIVLALDLGRLMASQILMPGQDENTLIPVTKTDYAVDASVLLSYVATRAEDKIALAGFAGDVETYIPFGKGHQQFQTVLEALTRLQPRPEESDYRRSFTYLGQVVRRRSLFVVFTDVMDPLSADRLTRELKYLMPRHLVLVVALADQELKPLLEEVPDNTDHMFRQTAAASILAERRRILARMESLGILTLDASPRDMSIATVNRYLEIKGEGKL